MATSYNYRTLLHVTHWNHKNYKRKSVSRVLVYVSGALLGLQMTRRHTPITRHIRPMPAIKDTPSTAITGRPKAISGLIKGFGSESHTPGSILRYCLRLSLLSNTARDYRLDCRLKHWPFPRKEIIRY